MLLVNDTPHFSRVNVSADGCAHSQQPSYVTTHQRSRACSILTFQLSFAFCCSLTSSSVFRTSRITRRDRYCYCSHSTFFCGSLLPPHLRVGFFSTEIYRASGTVCVAKGALFLTLKAQDCKYDAAADTEAVRHLC